MNGEFDWITELLTIAKILQANGIDVASIPTRVSKNGTRHYLTLKEISQQDIDIGTIISTNGLDGDYVIGTKITKIRLIYNGVNKGNIPDGQKKIAEELGIVKRIPEERQQPLIPGGKISTFHLDIARRHIYRIVTGELTQKELMKLINDEARKLNETQITTIGSVHKIIEIVLEEENQEVRDAQEVRKKRQQPLIPGGKISTFYLDIVRRHIDKILAGQLNTIEVMELINEEAIRCNEVPITSKSSVNKIVRMVLEGRKEDLKRYEDVLKSTTHRYPSQEREFRERIIQYYLPKLIAGDITIDMILKELRIGRETLEHIIQEHYLNKNDPQGFDEYLASKGRRQGVSTKKKMKSEEMREEVEKYEVVSNAEFLLLSEEEQDKQIVMKIRKEKLKEEKSKRKKGEERTKRLINKETAERAIQRIKNYFRSKNDQQRGIEYFSEQDIRFIIFRYPTIISRTCKTLDEKFKVLTSFEEINARTAYGMVKTYPDVIGYSVIRI